MCQAVGEVVAAGANSLHKTGTPVMYMQYGAFSDYKVYFGQTWLYCKTLN